MKYSCSILLSVICLTSCDNTYNPEKVAERYCDCMETNKATEDFAKADKTCGDKIVAENRYVKLWTVDFRDSARNNRITNDTRDSVKLFMNRFRDYTNANCCKEVLVCPDSTELK